MNYGDHNIIEITQPSCESIQSSSTLSSQSIDSLDKVERVERVEPCCSTMSTQPKCMGSTGRTCRVESSQVEFGLIQLRYPVPGAVLAGTGTGTKFFKMAGYPANRNQNRGTSLVIRHETTQNGLTHPWLISQLMNIRKWDGLSITIVCEKYCNLFLSTTSRSNWFNLCFVMLQKIQSKAQTAFKLLQIAYSQCFVSSSSSSSSSSLYSNKAVTTSQYYNTHSTLKT